MLSWSETAGATGEHAPVESIAIRDGMVLLLSRFEPGAGRTFRHVETQDVFGIGFHLRGGARFDMDAMGFSTRPFDVWAGTGPRCSMSRFTFPEQGFRTLSLRFTPEAACALLQAQGASDSVLMEVARAASEQVVARRLAPLDPVAAQLAEAMFAAPLAGSARRLFLESCAYALLATQLDAVRDDADGLATRRHADVRRGLWRARSLLEQGLDDPPSIAELARRVGVNEFTLKRDFKRLFGTTIFGYVRQRRMERAAVDLRAGMSVAQVAAAVGYECPRCFADAFRRHHGILPSAMTRRSL